MLCNFLARSIHWFHSASFSDRMEVAKLLAAGVAFGIGLWQYRRSQIWKRLEFVSAQMKIFFDDPAAREAMIMLDWRKKKMPLFKFRDEADEEYVTVDYKMVAGALDIDPEAHYDKKHSAIREAFERFLEYLARFEGFIEATAVEPKDLNPYLDYWVKLISGHDNRSPEVSREVLPSLWKFIDYYGYRDVRRFVNRYHAVAFPELKG
jgi:hypothetical protein